MNKLDSLKTIFPTSTILIQLSILESVGGANEMQLVTAAIPFAKGDVIEIDSLLLIDESNVQCLYNAHVTQYW